MILLLIFGMVVALVLFCGLRALALPIILLTGGVSLWHSVFGTPGAMKPEAAPVSDFRPVEQNRFCTIIEAADAAYERQRTAWYDEKNAIVRDRLTSVLAKMRDDRDQDILELVGSGSPKLASWQVKVNELLLTDVDYSDGKGVQKEVTLDLDVGCLAPVSLGTNFIMTPQTADLLAKVSEGSQILASGLFIGHDIDHNAAARALDWDAFEGTAMKSPSYRFTVTNLSGLQAVEIPDRILSPAPASTAPSAVYAPADQAVEKPAPARTSIASAPVDPDFAAFSKGKRDRLGWENFFAAAVGEERDGALWWSGQRGLKKPGSCSLGQTDQFRSGCEQAQAILGPTDVLRKTSPAYRSGWNSL